LEVRWGGRGSGRLEQGGRRREVWIVMREEDTVTCCRLIGLYEVLEQAC
jgi:hypothetical protein